MLCLAKPGQLESYRCGISRLQAMFPNDLGNSFGIRGGAPCRTPKPSLPRGVGWHGDPSHGLDNGRVRCTVMGEVLLNECRFAYLQGPLADWWREREVTLERGIRSKPGSAKTGAAPLGSPEMAPEAAPPLPSHQQQKYQEQPYAPPGAGTWGPGSGKGRKGKGRSVLDGKFLKDKWVQWGLVIILGSLPSQALFESR